MNIKKGDMVSVVSGNFRGKIAKVLHVDPAKNRLIVEGINMIKRHARPTRQNPKGGIITKEAPIHRSNVKLYCSSCSSPTRAGQRIIESKGSKVTKARFCRKCGAEL
jgi:large subunit ribosomal protein L24